MRQAALGLTDLAAASELYSPDSCMRVDHTSAERRKAWQQVPL